MIVSMCFQHEYPAIGNHIARREPWTSGCTWLHKSDNDPSQDELTRYFVALQRAGFDRIQTVSPGRYWIAYRQMRSAKAPLIIRHTVRVWLDITGAVKQRSLISASGAPVPRPGW
jgi:hypothetical protein